MWRTVSRHSKTTLIIFFLSSFISCERSEGDFFEEEVEEEYSEFEDLPSNEDLLKEVDLSVANIERDVDIISNDLKSFTRGEY